MHANERWPMVGWAWDERVLGVQDVWGRKVQCGCYQPQQIISSRDKTWLFLRFFVLPSKLLHCDLNRWPWPRGTSVRWPRPFVDLNPLNLVSLIHLFLCPQLHQPAAPHGVAVTAWAAEPVSGYTTQACCFDNNSPLSPVLIYPNPNPPLSVSFSCLGNQTLFG